MLTIIDILKHIFLEFLLYFLFIQTPSPVFLFFRTVPYLNLVFRVIPNILGGLIFMNFSRRMLKVSCKIEIEVNLIILNLMQAETSHLSDSIYY